jgi:hypothetical protein
MPEINGRFYLNPAFGRALERARLLDAEGQERANSHSAKHRAHTNGHDTATSIDGVTNQVYNETSGLRPGSLRGPGSDLELQQARVWIAHVIQNRAARMIRGGIAYDRLTGAEPAAVRVFLSKAYDAYGASHHAARLSKNQPDPTGGAAQFYLDYGQGSPPWAKGEKPVRSFGPFFNKAGRGDVPKGKMTRIVVIP